MKRIIRTLVVILILGLTGCSSINGGPEHIINAKEEIKEIKILFSPTEVKNYFEETNLNERKLLRNKIITSRIYAIDLQFSVYVQDLAKELRGSSFGIDLTSLLLTGTAAAITQGTASKALTGLDTFLKGGQQSFSKNILIDKTLDVLLTQMRANRKKVATQIWSNLKKYDDSIYSLPIALSQLEEYYQAGTITGALISISDSAVIAEKKAIEEFENEVIEVPYGKNEYTEILTKYIEEAKTLKEKNRRRFFIQNKLNEKGLKILTPIFLRSNEKEHRKIQKELIEIIIIGRK